MYIAVCDDQAEERDSILTMLQIWQEKRRVNLRSKSFSSATQLLDCVERDSFTLYLLDVVMPEMDGLCAARKIREHDDTAEIVFLTSSPDFACESYRVRALDYLLKPVDTDLLFSVLDRQYAKEQNLLDSLTLKAGTTLIRIPLSQLVYVEVNGKHLYFNLTDGSVREVFGSLNEYEAQLLCHGEFMRVHRSYIVNMLQAAELSPGGVRTFSGKNIPISRRLYPRIQQEYLKLLFNRGEG